MLDTVLAYPFEELRRLAEARFSARPTGPVSCLHTRGQKGCCGPSSGEGPPRAAAATKLQFSVAGVNILETLTFETVMNSLQVTKMLQRGPVDPPRSDSEAGVLWHCAANHRPHCGSPF
ncbi:hypothetical protein NN561_007134 [Cricetulus griseus]